MERKNTVLLTVIAVATLLVAVVGATFAYFTATTTTTDKGTGTSAELTTTELNGATITFDGETDKFELLDYPGGIGVFGAKATITKTEGVKTDEKDYQATFNLKIEYTNKTGTDLDWELYMVEEKNKLTNLNLEETTVCKLQTKTTATDTYYWYADSDTPGYTEGNGDPTNAGCTAKAITEALTTGEEATKIASGKLNNVSTESGTGTVDKNSDEPELQKEGYNGDLAQRTINTKDNSTKYYYLVVKYPNKNDTQDSDQGKEISVKLSLDGTPVASLYEG